MPPAWTTFRIKSTRFLAVDRDSGWHIVDQDGGNFGSWLDLRAFAARFRRHEPGLCLGRAAVSIAAIIHQPPLSTEA